MSSRRDRFEAMRAEHFTSDVDHYYGICDGNTIMNFINANMDRKVKRCRYVFWETYDTERKQLVQVISFFKAVSTSFIDQRYTCTTEYEANCFGMYQEYRIIVVVDPDEHDDSSSSSGKDRAIIERRMGHMACYVEKPISFEAALRWVKNSHTVDAEFHFRSEWRSLNNANLHCEVISSSRLSKWPRNFDISPAEYRHRLCNFEPKDVQSLHHMCVKSVKFDILPKHAATTTTDRLVEIFPFKMREYIFGSDFLYPEHPMMLTGPNKPIMLW
jgi:hypothetical protein